MRPTLLLAGFYGRGNAGDEAMLQCMVEALRDEFDFILSVDERGAFDGFWDWFPYNESRIIHATRIAEALEDPSLAGMVVGGGALPPGMAAAQLFCARGRGLPVALSGVDLWHPALFPHGRWVETIGRWLGLFDHVGVRTARGLAQSHAFGRGATHAADWALRLVTDRSPAVQPDPRRALIVLREQDQNNLPAGLRAWIDTLIEGIERAGLHPALLPFSPEDLRHIGHLGLDGRAPVVEEWANPRRLKQWIAGSGLLVSVGRLHPMIFAADTPCPVATLRMPFEPPPPWQDKLADMAEELGAGIHATLADFMAALAAGRVGCADPTRVGSARARLDAEVAALRALFATR